MTLEQSQVNVQELQRLHEAIAITMDAIRRIAPYLQAQGYSPSSQAFGQVGQGYSPFSQTFGQMGQPLPWQQLGQPSPWQPIGQQTPWQPIGQQTPWHLLQQQSPWQQPQVPWQPQVGAWQQPYGIPSPFGYAQPGFGQPGVAGYGQSLDPMTHALLHAQLMRSTMSQPTIGTFGPSVPWQQPGVSPFFGASQRPF